MGDLKVEVILDQLRRHRQDVEDSVKRYDSATTVELLDKLTVLRRRAEDLLGQRPREEQSQDGGEESESGQRRE